MLTVKSEPAKEVYTADNITIYDFTPQTITCSTDTCTVSGQAVVQFNYDNPIQMPLINSSEEPDMIELKTVPDEEACKVKFPTLHFSIGEACNCLLGWRVEAGPQRKGTLRETSQERADGDSHCRAVRHHEADRA